MQHFSGFGVFVLDNLCTFSVQATGGVITVAGDTMAQLVAQKNDGASKSEVPAKSLGKDGCMSVQSLVEGMGLDFQRSVSMLGWGTLVSGVGLFYWFRFLDRLFPPDRNTVMRVLAKVGVNQLGLAFPMNGCFFGVSTARNHDLGVATARAEWLKDWERKVRQDLPITVLCPHLHISKFQGISISKSI